MPTNLKCALGLVVLFPACATTMYDGPLKSEDQVATIVAIRTTVIRIDGRQTSQVGGSFAVLPGTHLVVAYLRDYTRVSYAPLAICFDAEKGRSYQTNPHYVDDRHWELEIVDEDSSEPVAARRVESWSQDCARAEAVAPSPRPLPWRLTLTQPRLLADSSPDGASDPSAAEAQPTATAPAVVPAPAPVAAPPPAPTGAVRGEGARSKTIHRPGNGFGMVIGGAFGGQEIARGTFTDGHMETINAGGGVVLALSGSWTPIWIGQVLGLGASTTIGYKMTQIADNDGNSLQLASFPLDLSLQLLLAVQRHWYLVVRAGAQKELHVHFSGQGFAAPVDQFFTAPIGAQVEGGLLVYAGFTGIGLTVKSSSVRYETGAGSIDASNVAILASMHFFF